MLRQHHHLSEHESEPTLGDSEGRGSLAYCSSWGHKELDTAQQLNNNNSMKLDCCITQAFYINAA